MYRALNSVEPSAVDAALASLEQAGLLVATGATVRASDALERLERLDLIGV